MSSTDALSESTQRGSGTGRPPHHGPSPAPGSRSWVRRLAESDESLHTAVLCCVIVAVSVGLFIATPDFLTFSNSTVIAQSMVVLGTAAIGQTIVILGGGFDLSVGGVLPLAGVVFAVTANSADGGVLSVLTGLVAALATGIAFGVLNGIVVAHVQINPLIATLGTLSIAGGAAYLFNEGQTTILEESASASLASTVAGSLTWDVLVYTALAVLTSLVLHFTGWGRRIYSIGGSLEAVRRAGVRTDRVVVGMYVWSGVFAALAGVLATSQLQAGSASANTNAALQTVTAVILGGAALTGGRGAIYGTVLGSLLLAIIANGLNILHINSFYQTIITGVVLLAAVGMTSVRQKGTRMSLFGN